MESLAAEEALAALGRLLSRPRPQLGVLRFNARQWLDFYPAAAGLPFFAAVIAEVATVLTKIAAVLLGVASIRASLDLWRHYVPVLDAYLPRQLTIVSTFTIGIPGFFLALAPDPRRARTGFVARVVRFAVPAGVIAAAAALGGAAFFRPAIPAPVAKGP